MRLPCPCPKRRTTSLRLPFDQHIGPTTGNDPANQDWIIVMNTVAERIQLVVKPWEAVRAIIGKACASFATDDVQCCNACLSLVPFTRGTRFIDPTACCRAAGLRDGLEIWAYPHLPLDEMLVTLVPGNSFNDQVIVPMAFMLLDVKAAACARLFAGCQPSNITLHDFEDGTLLDDIAWARLTTRTSPYLRVACCGPLDSSAFLYLYDKANGHPLKEPITISYKSTCDQLHARILQLLPRIGCFRLELL